MKEFDRPTRDNNALWSSPEKDWFLDYSNSSPYNEDCSIQLSETGIKGVVIMVSFRFYVTSYIATLAIRQVDSPGAFKDPYIVPTEKWGTIAETGWGENGSGFNQKYISALRLLEATALGDWSAWSPLLQENRSTSFSMKTGENTRFWSAELTDPGVAQREYKFPLTIRPPKLKIADTRPCRVDVGVVVTSRLHPELGEMEIIARSPDEDLWLVERSQHSPTRSGSCERRMVVKTEQLGEPVRWSHCADFLLQQFENCLKGKVSFKYCYSNHLEYSRNVIDPRSAITIDQKRS